MESVWHRRYQHALLWVAELNLNFRLMIGLGVVWIGWLIFCAWRLAAGIRHRHYRPEATEWDREDFGFALGGVIASLVLIPAWMLTPIWVR